MKLVTAIIKPFKLDDVREAVAELGIEGLTVTEVKALGIKGPYKSIGAEYQVDFLPKVRLDIATSSDLVEPLLDAICKAAHMEKLAMVKYSLPLSNKLSDQNR